MAGKKGRSGSGGARPGSGPRRRRLYFNGDQAPLIAHVTNYHRRKNPDLTEEDVAYDLFEREWQRIGDEVRQQYAMNAVLKAEQEYLDTTKEHA